MYIGFISYSFGDHYSWVCKDWKEMVAFCLDMEVEIDRTEPSYLDDRNYYQENNDGTWISIGLASEYSLNQIKQFKDES
jgi:hypothetical protein